MIDWLIQTTADLPPDDAHDWLSAPERERLAALFIPKRRADWLLGRWTAKRLAQTVITRETGHAPAFANLVIAAHPDGAPHLRDYPHNLSISHSQGQAFCALHTNAALGADIERIEARAAVFVEDYFTPPEVAAVAAAPPALRDAWVTAIWSAKEAALKALRLGLGVDTRSLTCLGDSLDAAWRPFLVTYDTARLGPVMPLAGWWRLSGGFILSLASSSDDAPRA